MGLIMLILIGTVPTAYALNHAVNAHDIQDFIAASERAVSIVDAHVDKSAILGGDPRSVLTDYLRTKKLQPDTMTALREALPAFATTPCEFRSASESASRPDRPVHSQDAARSSSRRWIFGVCGATSKRAAGRSRARMRGRATPA